MVIKEASQSLSQERSSKRRSGIQDHRQSHQYGTGDEGLSALELLVEESLRSKRTLFVDLVERQAVDMSLLMTIRQNMSPVIMRRIVNTKQEAMIIFHARKTANAMSRKRGTRQVQAQKELARSAQW